MMERPPRGGAELDKVGASPGPIPLPPRPPLRPPPPAALGPPPPRRLQVQLSPCQAGHLTHGACPSVSCTTLNVTAEQRDPLKTQPLREAWGVGWGPRKPLQRSPQGRGHPSPGPSVTQRREALWWQQKIWVLLNQNKRKHITGVLAFQTLRLAGPVSPPAPWLRRSPWWSVSGRDPWSVGGPMGLEA